jgi:hypothetical protein
MSERIEIDIDTSAGLAKLQQLETARQNSITAINTALSMARTAYLGMTAIVRIGGGTVSTIFNTVISAGISAIQVLYPIFTAMAAGAPVSPIMGVQAAIGFVNLGIAISAIVASQAQQQEVANRLHSANALMHSVQMMVGQIHTLW